MYYKVKAWIPVEEEDVEIYAYRDDALNEATDWEAMQPENLYLVVECDENGEDL